MTNHKSTHIHTTDTADRFASARDTEMTGAITAIPDDDEKNLSTTPMFFHVESEMALDSAFPAFEDVPARHQHDVRDMPSYLSGSNDGLEALSEFLTTIPDVPVHGVPDCATSRPDDKQPPDTRSSVDGCGQTALSTRSRNSHLLDANIATSCSHIRFLKPVSEIRKPAHHRSFMGSPVTELKRYVSSVDSNASNDTALLLPPVAPAESRRDARPTSDVETKRLQHNLMMRANRERVNSRFQHLEKLLVALESPDLPTKPMRNKIQTLDRAMLQYPALQARKASLRAQLVLEKCSDRGSGPSLADAFSGALGPACETVARIAFGKEQWKYAEVYLKSEHCYRLSAALVSPGNMARTQEKLHAFSRRRASSDTARFIRGAAKLGESVWIPDVRRRECGGVAARCGVSSAMFVPVVLNEGRMADAVIALYHADDEVMTFPGGIRPYSADAVAHVDQLASAFRGNPNVVF